MYRTLRSVPAKLGNGQGAKEIGHNLAREQPKFGHNLVRKRHKIGHSLERLTTFTRERPKFGHNPACEPNEVWVQFCGRSMKTWAQICKYFCIGCLTTQKQQLHFVKKKNCFIREGRCVDRAMCKTVRAGRSALGNIPSWNTGLC